MNVVRSFSLMLLLATAAQLHAQQVSPVQTAEEEAVRRQEATISLRKKIQDGEAAQKRAELDFAAKLYEDALKLVSGIGAGVEPETQRAITGLVAVRLQLANRAQAAGNLAEADAQLARALRVDPRNLAVVDAKKANDKAIELQRGKAPSPEGMLRVAEVQNVKDRANTLVQDGRLFFELGKLEDANAKLEEAAKLDPDNRAAFFYLKLIQEARYAQEARKRELASSGALVEVEKAWNTTVERHKLPTPNPIARTNLVHTSKGRQEIMTKLDRIRLNEVLFPGLPLREVVKYLREESIKRDPDKKGLNFIISSTVDSAVQSRGTNIVIDPVTQLPIPAAAAGGETVDLGEQITVKLDPPLVDLRLADVLDIVVKVAESPRPDVSIKYTIEDYGIIFSARLKEPQPLYTRVIKVDPNTFKQGLEGVFLEVFGTGGGFGGGQGGGGFGGGGGGFGGGGGGFGGGGRGGGLGGGGGGFGGGGRGGGLGGGGGGFGGGGGGFGGGQGGGIQQSTYLSVDFQQILNVTATNTTLNSAMLRQYFLAVGVDLTTPPGKAIVFNDRAGALYVRATLEDIEAIEQIVQVLNLSPPQVMIEAKFAEIGQDDSRELGFDWFLGNSLINNGNVVGSGGTQPSLAGTPSAANPFGNFPGFPTPANTLTAPSTTDQRLTSGLRNTAPAVATLTGILTDPQFRMVIRALEQRKGADLLSAPKITTLSGRQAQIKLVEAKSVVIDLSISQTAGGAGVGAVGGAGAVGGGGAAVGSIIQPLPVQIELGPILDVVPSVSADGYTIQMTVIPTLKEFLGYDFETGQRFAAIVQSATSSGAGNPVSSITPLPSFRVRQVVTSVNVWDGQTVVLGGLISEDVQKTKDKVPVLGDMPWLGRFFRSESSATKKKNLVIFITPTIIDPAGNRVHTDEELPFAQSAFPPQKPIQPNP